MKDALGHGSNPRGEHASKVDQLGKPWSGVGYHGTASQFEQFEPREPQIKATGGTDLRGIYFSGDPQSASSYAGMAARRAGGGQRRVIEANLSFNNPLDITKAIANGRKRGLSFGDAKREALKGVTPQHDGVIFRGNSYNPPEYIAFNSRSISRKKP